jgi:signal transduction histidine kinase/CheY-like chemotaxis protein
MLLKSFHNLPIQKKLTRLIVLISSAILLITGLSFFAYDYYTFKQATLEKLNAVGSIIATNSTAALAFNSEEDAYDILSAMSAEPYIETACIYDLDGNLFSFFPSNAILKMKLDLGDKKAVFSSNYLETLYPIIEGDNKLGTLYLRYNLSAINTRIKLYSLIASGVFLVSFLLVWFFSKTLQKSISAPILNLSKAAESISRKKDYSVRVEKFSNDEIGQLTIEFNNMLSQIESQNKTLSSFNSDLLEKTEQLELASKYKSEFLANMSHELRSPLNSLLILSHDLASNKTGNLTDEQTESSQIIYDSGTDLLNLINDILDLSKIEAGKMEANIGKVSISSIINTAQNVYSPLTNQKGLSLRIEVDKNVPPSIETDEQRVNQILKNLLSNAIKFTKVGEIKLHITKSDSKVYFHVSDSGIGIPKEKQNLIFEAFKQADGGTSRRYGGTGLGLSIATQLAKLLHGELTIESEANIGSTFTLSIPFESTHEIAANSPTLNVEIISETRKKEEIKDEFLDYQSISDDRGAIAEHDKVVLIIEDDLSFAQILKKESHANNFKCLAASTGEDGLQLARNHNVNAIILDLKLPGISGLTVLGILKSDVNLRHIPVHVISAVSKSDTPIKSSVVNYLTKPVNADELHFTFELIENFNNRKVKNLLIVEDEEKVRKAVALLFTPSNAIKIFQAASIQQALKELTKNIIDCIVLDLTLTDGSGLDLIKELSTQKNYKIPPVIVYTGKDLVGAEIDQIKVWAESIIIKDNNSGKRLLDETTLFLHQKITDLSEHNQRIISEVNNKEVEIIGKKILIVDDDMRNIFALSKFLKSYSVNIYKSESGLSALETLKNTPDIDLVLMDIMMPDMDGYEAMRKIREQEQFKSLPIIALTAKAMAEDRKKCLDAGASDYFSKPVDVDKLLDLIKLWLR